MSQYKDSFFRTVFNTEEAALDIYNALHDTAYDERTEVIINTLTETLWTAQKNDMSFLLEDKIILMGEQQSTINRNMSFRFLQPIGRLFYRGIPDKKAIYRQAIVPLPRPEFLVIYNGSKPYQERSVMRLSDAFKYVEGNNAINLDLTAMVYNINDGIKVMDFTP